MKAYGAVNVETQVFLHRYQLEVSGQLHDQAAFPLGETARGVHRIGGWVGPRSGLDDAGNRKISPLPGFELRPLCSPAHSQSLYRLRYTGSGILYIPVKYFENHYQGLRVVNGKNQIKFYFILLWLGSSLLGLGRFFSFLMCTQSVGPFGRVIRPL
jgi:hypothetical protein